jgi:hypothetical protein
MVDRFFACGIGRIVFAMLDKVLRAKASRLLARRLARA